MTTTMTDVVYVSHEALKESVASIAKDCICKAMLGHEYLGLIINVYHFERDITILFESILSNAPFLERSAGFETRLLVRCRAARVCICRMILREVDEVEGVEEVE